MKKESIGALVILGGIALIGFIWFKRNKPTTSDVQLAELTAESNKLLAGRNEDLDKAFEIDKESINNPYRGIDVSPTYLTVKEQNEITKAIGVIFDPSVMVSNQISQNMQNADFSQLGNIGVANIDFTNIKIK